jgi:hypothetical protein
MNANVHNLAHYLSLVREASQICVEHTQGKETARTFCNK